MERIFGPGFDEALGCAQPNDAACLQAAPVASILAAQGEVFGANGISPDFGTKILPHALQQAFSAESIHPRPRAPGHQRQ